MKKKRKMNKTEKANIELNNAFYDENDDYPDVDPLINNNNIPFVVKDLSNEEKDKDKDNEDM